MISPPELDRRYRMLVLLQRSDRHTHYKFHCPRCTMPVCELVNREVKAISDVIEMETFEGVGVRCDGRFQGSRCNNWFFFTLS